MATRTLVVMEDDIDGSRATETVKFSLDGIEYSIDLSGRNAEKLRGDMEKWIKAAHKTGGRRSTSRKAAPTDKDQISRMRAWLQDHGYDVSTRGRIPAHLQDVYHQSV